MRDRVGRGPESAAPDECAADPGILRRLRGPTPPATADPSGFAPLRPDRPEDTDPAACRHPGGKHDRLHSSGNLASRRRDVTEETAAPVSGAMDVRDAVTVRMPADSAYLSVLRTATAGLAARLDFTLDEIEHLRIGVDIYLIFSFQSLLVE